jgi:RNA polymerase sigma-70 factor, ECF subfamily
VPLAQIDNSIVRKAQRGDPHAFALIVRAYQVPVFNYVLRIVGDRGLAEDLTQEVFLRVFQSLPSFSFRSRFTTWLFQVTRYRVLDEVRARERRPRSSDLDAVHTLGVVDAPAEQAETIEALWRAVDRLGLDLKMALLLRDIAGFSYNEIAEILEITLATVKWRIYKAREEVQLTLTRQGIVTTRRAEDASARRLRTADGAGLRPSPRPAPPPPEAVAAHTRSLVIPSSS